MRYTPKQIEKYQRQRYIGTLEKMTKNLFKMFRNEATSQEQFLEKFYEIKKKLDDFVDIRLDSEYHYQLKDYIEKLYQETLHEFKLEKIREANMTLLNRLQKLKNGSSYKKDKHKYSSRNQDWG